VQTVAKIDEKRVAESDLSEEAVIKPVDTFPPAAPAGLHATIGPASIELSWDPNGESDVAGYRVYRSAGGGAFGKIADVGIAPSYSDRTVKKDTAYRYQVSAVDRAGNESTRSESVEAQ
jgi:fibronectin type 3 domain-containing protein